MHISHVIVADAANQLPDGRLNLLGANWTAIAVPEVPTTLPIVIAFGAEGEAEEAGVHRARVDFYEPNGKHTVLVDEPVEITKTEGPEGIPGISVGGLFDGLLEVAAAGVHRVHVQIGDAEAETVFVVHQRSRGAPKTRPRSSDQAKQKRRKRKATATV